MRLPLNKFLEKLGVGHTLSPYETYPWFLHDDAQKITCSAEVRMGPDNEDVEAEIQFLHDEKSENEESDSGESGQGDSSTFVTARPGSREQILWMRATPISPGEWSPKLLRIKGQDYVNAFHDWEEKGCEFFVSCIEALQMGIIPDIDALVEDKMKDDSAWGGGRSGRVGRKSPKVKPGQLMGMKKP
ncbi:MAG: hypothetical protein IT559_03295 [Alphaproteobacteria bacterium]|nr:hypothetical protein [Alphaproteobacteria bacterium]